jgi:hypothetical protein
MGGAILDGLSVDSNAIRCDLHVIAGDCGDWLH